jgi:hypothetical protein
MIRLIVHNVAVKKMPPNAATWRRVACGVYGAPSGKCDLERPQDVVKETFYALSKIIAGMAEN